MANIVSPIPTTETAPALEAFDGRAATGKELREVLTASARWLEKHTEAINALNVFPVPDGDTGTNMASTAIAAVEEIDDMADATAEAVIKKLAYGALMGARGNSGVILSQVVRGLADGLSGKPTFRAADLAEAFAKATATAYRAVMKPVEGTILTVVRDAGEAAQRAAAERDNILYVMEETLKAAKASVARTPQLLEKLREAGVVDAGGEGYAILLEGAVKFLRRESLDIVALDATLSAKPIFSDDHNEDEFGYCTNFMLHADPAGDGWDYDQVRADLSEMGQSAVIVGDDRTLKVHLHSEDPGAILQYATRLGALDQIKLDNMTFQHNKAFRGGTATAARHSAPAEAAPVAAHTGHIGIVSVVTGDGLEEIFRNFGAGAIVRGGQTMNPSLQEMVAAVDSLPQDQVLILPNNKNIILVAQQVSQVSRKSVRVVPSATIPQGITALTRFNFDSDLDANADAMTDALAQVQTGEITRAVRSVVTNGVEVQEGQWIGLLNDQLSVADDDQETAVWCLLDGMRVADHEVISIYSGSDVADGMAEALRAKIADRYDEQSVELYPGGQPHYDYILSAE